MEWRRRWKVCYDFCTVDLYANKSNFTEYQTKATTRRQMADGRRQTWEAPWPSGQWETRNWQPGLWHSRQSVRVLVFLLSAVRMSRHAVEQRTSELCQLGHLNFYLRSKFNYLLWVLASVGHLDWSWATTLKALITIVKCSENNSTNFIQLMSLQINCMQSNAMKIK